MSIMIKASYESEAEIMEIDRCLSPLRLIRKDEPQKGRFRRSYFKSKDLIQSEREEKKAYKAGFREVQFSE